MSASRRRSDQFRQVVPLSTVIKVQILVNGRKIGNGRIADLSLGGMGVLLDRRSNAACARCNVRFKLPGEKRPLELPCNVVHRHSITDDLMWGLVFSDIDEPSREGERSVLWQFLADQHVKRHPFSVVARER